MLGRSGKHDSSKKAMAMVIAWMLPCTSGIRTVEMVDHGQGWNDPVSKRSGDSVATCLWMAHSFIYLGHCRRSPDSLESIFQGCRFEEKGNRHQRFSTLNAVGFGGDDNTAGSAILGFIPGVGDGTVRDDEFRRKCDNAIPWEVNQACARAIVADLGPIYDEHRAWAWHAFANPTHLSITSYRSQYCGDALRPRAFVKRKARLWKPKALCWDFVNDFRNLYCESQRPGTKAPYKELCSFSQTSWDGQSDLLKAKVLREMDDEVMQSKNRSFVLPAARRKIDALVEVSQAFSSAD